MDRALSRLSRSSSSCVRVLSSCAVSNQRMISLTIASCSLVSQIFVFFQCLMPLIVRANLMCRRLMGCSEFTGLFQAVWTASKKSLHSDPEIFKFEAIVRFPA